MTEHTEDAPTVLARRTALADLAGPALIALVVALAVPGLWRSAGAPMEEGFMLVFPEQLLDGRLPHRDFLHLYGPGSLWVLAAAFRTFGVSIGTERVIGLIQHLLVCFGVYALVRPAGRRLATVAGLTSALIVLTPLGLAALAWDGALGLAVAGLALGVRSIPAVPPSGADVVGVAVHEASPRRLPIASGALCAAALLYRPDMAVALGVAMILLLRRLSTSGRRSFAVGFLPVAATVLVHLVTSGVGASIRGMLLEPLVELRPGRHLPIPPSWSTVDGYLQRTAALDIPNDWSLRWFGLSQQIFLWFVVAVVVTVGLLVGARRLRRRDGVPPSPAADAFVVGGTWSALLVTQALQRPDSAHLAWVTAVSLPIALGLAGHLLGCELLGESGRGVAGRLGTARAGWVALAASVAFLVGVVPFFPLRAYREAVSVGFGDGRPGTEIERGDRRFLFGSPEGARSAQRVVDRLDRLAKPGDRLIVGTADLSRTVYSDAYLYHLFGDLRVGTRFIEMDPGIADAADSPLPKELERSDWLVLSTLWDGWNEPNESTDSRSQAANRVVRRDYCPVLDAGAYRLLRRCR